MRRYLLLGFILLVGLSSFALFKGEEVEQKYEYSDFQRPIYCGAACHQDIYRQWEKSMMAQAFTHEWDEIEYFDLALEHARLDPKVAEVEAGCNGCHTPMAYLTGDIPPKRPSENTRANEGVSCDVCHSIAGFKGDIPFNFNYIMKPGITKFNSRKGDVGSPNHKIEINPIMKTGDFCGICHNEKSPYGVWVKSTHLEWKEGPYFKENVHCQDCHMPKAETRKASMGKVYPDVRQHIFNGGHDKGKVKGVVELTIYPDFKEAEPGDDVRFTINLFNQKTGHKFPTGSVEDRLLWMHVEATDSKGNVYHLPVDKKGFKGEEYTISKNILAYQDMGVPLKIPDFKGVDRDGIPEGNRIFRMPYFDPQGRMTIQQWNTSSLGVDYRIGPRETKIENCTFRLPDNLPPGKLTVKAVLNYQLLIEPVARFLKVPAEEYEIVEVNRAYTEIEILD